MFEVLGPGTKPAVATVAKSSGDVRKGLDLPCKNVDLQTGAQWAMSAERAKYTAPESGYMPLSLIKDVGITAGLQRALIPGATAGGGLGKTGGWFFSTPKGTSTSPYDSQLMMASPGRPFGEVINLNPACFGEVYWVGGAVGQTYMVFAVWLPYREWVSAELPIIIHFRPYYNDSAYGEAEQNAGAQGVPLVLGKDKQGRQTFLDGAWYYLLGLMGFVPQMLAMQRLAAMVLPMPPEPKMMPQSDRGSTLYPNTFIADLPSIVSQVVDAAVNVAGKSGAGEVSASTEHLIFTANSQGGAYLNAAVQALRSAVNEVWIFDGNQMDAARKVSVASRLYIAQQGTYRDLLAMPASGAGVRLPWELEASTLSVVDISRVPDNGSDRHDLCGRVCFSHAASLSPLLVKFPPSNKLNRTIGPTEAECWPDRLEFWIQRTS